MRFIISNWRARVHVIIISTIALSVITPSVHASPITSPLANVFINEFHYDNTGSDSNEFIELAGVAGTNLTDWQIQLYNGSNGEVYQTIKLPSYTLIDQHNGFGLFSIAFSGIQNGSPDGIALVDNANQLIQFISYEGVLVGQNGVAENILSEDVGVIETSSTKLNYSLQLTGNGSRYQDFNWYFEPLFNTAGTINMDQSFIRHVPEPDTLFILLPALWCLYRAKHQKFYLT